MRFEFFAFRFYFEASEPVRFPEGQSGNIIRGAFGAIFRRLACAPACPGPRLCELRETCPYARIFEPAALDPGPSGLRDLPRPFVFRAMHLDGTTVPPGESFHFDVHIFYPEESGFAYFVLAFAELAQEGLGPDRGKAALVRVEQLNALGAVIARVYENGAIIVDHLAPRISLRLLPDEYPITRVKVRFVSPTELKSGSVLALRPDFNILFARLRDRISTLRALYGSGPLDIDFRAMGERAARVRLVRCEIEQHDVLRRSSKTGRTHPIGGFTGIAEYAGDLAEFLPYLRAGKWTGVGRQTVWGKGHIEIG